MLPFNKLLEIFDEFPEQEVNKDENEKKSKYEKLFDYGKYQPEIAKFFMKYSEELNLKTCYFCNIDFINVFDDRDNVKIYKNVLEVLNEKNYDDLICLNEIGDSSANKIIKYPNNFEEEKDLENIDGIGKTIRKKIFETDIEKINSTKKNHFTLDHFLPKAQCPILALSLYNFVPSCYSCNSKFKKEKKLLESYFSPTSDNFSVGKDIKFKIYFKDKIAKNDLTLQMEYPDKVKEYVSTFKLKGRYNFHQNEASILVDKQEKYSESRIEEIANILKISSHQVKKDIFGEELFSGDVQDKSFTKIKRDIAENIGIRGVKDD